MERALVVAFKVLENRGSEIKWFTQGYTINELKSTISTQAFQH